MVRREIAATSQALQVAFSRLFQEPMFSESTSFGSRWGIYEMSSRHDVIALARESGVDVLQPEGLADLLGGRTLSST
jgi:hypothetical protein